MKDWHTQENNEDEAQDIIAVLGAYGVEVNQWKDVGWTKINCPFHNDRIASASISVELGVFWCFACNVKGSAVKVIQVYEGVGYASARSKYEEITMGKAPGIRKGSVESFRGYDLLGEPRTYERNSKGISHWFRSKPSEW